MERQQRQYVGQQPQTQPPPRQYIQSGNGVYHEVPPNNFDDRRMSYFAAQQPVPNNNNGGRRISYVGGAPPQPIPPPPKQVSTRIITTSNNNNNDSARVLNRIEAAVPARSTFFEAEGQMIVAASAILAGFLLISIIQSSSDKVVIQSSSVTNNIKEAQILALQLVSFGCFISALIFYMMYVMHARGLRSNYSMRSWIYCGRAIFMIGLILLVAIVAMTSRMQLGEEYENIWIASVTSMIVIVLLPVICHVIFLLSKLVGSLLGFLDSLW